MFSFKRASNKDIPFLLELRKATMVLHLENQGIFLSEEEHLNLVKEDFDCIRLIYENGKVVGMIKKIDRKAYLALLQFQLLPDYQGKGIGRQLLKDLIEEAKEQHKTIKLSVLKKNPAYSLYSKLGFQMTGEDDFEYFMEI